MLDIIDAYFFNQEKHCSAASVLILSSTSFWKLEKIKKNCGKLYAQRLLSGFISNRHNFPTWFLKCIRSTLTGVEASKFNAYVRLRSRSIWFRMYATKWHPSSYTIVGASRPDTKITIELWLKRIFQTRNYFVCMSRINL